MNFSQKYLLPFNLSVEFLIITLNLLFGYIHFHQIDLIIFCNIIWFAGSFITKSYYINRLPGFLINAFNLTKLFALFFLLFFVYIDLFHFNQYYHLAMIKDAIIMYICLIGWRFVFFYILKKSYKTNTNKAPAVIVGVSVNSIHLKEFIESHPEYGITVAGFFSDKDNDKVNVLGDLKDVYDYCLTHSISEIICSIDKVSKEYLNELIDFTEHHLITIRMLPDTTSYSGGGYDVTYLEYIPLLAIRKNPFDDVTNQFLKRSFDIVFSFLVIVLLLSWLLPILAIFILIESKGPIFFLQQRTGLNKKTFKCIKLRTMVVNKYADEKQAEKNDSRITKFGAFLRKTSLDELPQFFNVFTGSMSVVGPRPHMLKHTEEYSQIVNKYMIRHLVKPGITGLSQVMGYRGETQHDLYLMKMRVRMDRFYIENWSFYLDLKIIYSTIITIFKKNHQIY
jgi:putative colanic acid biosynthesis UDP-glucose lipid carrier transferase